MSTPFFTVVIPAFDQSRYFARAVQSVLDQTFKDWELIVVDDGSRDDEAKRIDSVMAEASRQVPLGKIRFSRHANQGVSVTRNGAAVEAQASWLAFLDNDDLWLPTMLEDTFRVLEAHPESALCHTNFDYIDADDDFIGHGFGRAITYLDFLAGNFPILPCCSVVKKSVFHQVGGFDPLYPLAQDLDFYLKIFSRSHETHFIDAPLALYRSHENNVSQNYRGSFNEISQILEKHLIYGLNAKRYDVARAARRGLVRIKSTYGEQSTTASIRSYQEKNFVAAVAHGAYALRLHPTSFYNGVTNGIKRKMLK